VSLSVDEGEYRVRRIGGVDVVVTNQAGAIGQIAGAVEAGETRAFGFCNAHTVNHARTDQGFAQAAQKIVLFNDGIGLDIASRILYGSSFPDNLNGTDLTPLVLSRIPAGMAVYLLGAAPCVAESSAIVLARKFPHIHFVGTEHGFFKVDEEASVVERIRAAGTRLVLVGMGHPRQELWAMRNVDSVGAVIMCVGAFLDFSAGRVSRAPLWMRAARMEWVYRLLLEPRRMASRYIVGNMMFLWFVLRQRFATR
jgi:exopolysaccharide biosynthesis WecB/TagA/CpsF family protein